jgi:hypothetical protein
MCSEKDCVWILDQILNHPTGCLGVVHQYALKTGMSNFCHLSCLSTTASFSMSNGKISMLSFASQWHCLIMIVICWSAVQKKNYWQSID